MLQIRNNISSIYYAGSLGCLDDCLIHQVSDDLSIYCYNFLQNCQQKSFQFHFFLTLKKKIKNFEFLLSALSPSQQPNVLFSIYQDNTWTIRWLINETINTATQRIMLKIIGFQQRQLTSGLVYNDFGSCKTRL